MESIIDKLYDLEVDISSFLELISKEDIKRESIAYAHLYKNLPQKEKEIFAEYLQLKSDRHKEELKTAYKLGFKSAIKIAMEMMKD